MSFVANETYEKPTVFNNHKRVASEHVKKVPLQRYIPASTHEKSGYPIKKGNTKTNEIVEKELDKYKVEIEKKFN